MRALIIAAGCSPFLQNLNSFAPAPLVPCVDRPILQHLVESAVDRGIVRLDFVLHDRAHEIEEFLGDGSRWGCRFTFHLARDPQFPYESLKFLALDAEPLLLMHGGQIPLLPEREVLNEHAKLPAVLYVSAPAAPGSSDLEWSGSAMLQPALVADSSSAIGAKELEAKLRRLAGEDAIETVDVLDLRHFDAFLQAQKAVLGGALAISDLAARQVEPGIWLARNVVIHPTAHLTPPLFIGENCRIGSAVKIGPNAVIGHDSIVDQQTEVMEAAVLPGSYCGEHLQLEHVIVSRNRLLRNTGTALNVSDSFILGGIKSQEPGWSLLSLISRAAALLLLLLTIPVVVTTAFCLLLRRARIPIHAKRVVRIPALVNSEPLQTFALYSLRSPSKAKSYGKSGWLLLDFLPALGQVVWGNLRLIGVRPLTENEVQSLPPDWRELYLQSHAGLLTEAFVIHGPLATEDEVYSSELYYNAMKGIGHDLSLALHFVTGPE